MSTDHNRIKVADLEKNQPDKILITDANGELEFQDAKNIKPDNYNALDYTIEGKALDARQGKILKDLIDTKSENKSNKTDDIEANKASSVKYTSPKSVVDWIKSFLFPNLSSKTTFIDTDLILTGDSEDSFKTKTGTFAQFKNNLKTYFDGIYQSVLVSGLNIKTVNGTSLLGNGNIVTPDMNTTTPQTVSGVKTFLNLMLGLRNDANTFTSFITNAVSASRTWTFPDKSGIIAMTSDLPTNTNTIATGTHNYLPKYNNVGGTQVGNSRLKDDGTYFGIGTVKNPLKDITLGNQGNKEIGIEESSNAEIGRDLIISAGRTINYIENSKFNVLTNNLSFIVGMCSTPSGNIYAVNHSNRLFKQTGGTGDFVDMGIQFPGGAIAICSNPSNDLYVAIQYGDIYKQTNEMGSFVSLEQPKMNWYGLCSLGTNIYASVYGGDIYKQTNSSGNFIALGQVARNWRRMDSSSTSIYAVDGINIYKLANETGDFNFHATSPTSCIAISNSNDIYVNIGTDMYKQTNETGPFVATGSTVTDNGMWGTAVHINGNIYVGDFGNTIYMLQNNGAGPIDLAGGTLKLKAGTGKGTGRSRFQIITGQKTTSGTSMQVETVRAEFDENGNYRRIGTPIYADNATALANGLIPGMEYRTSTGIKMEVY